MALYVKALNNDTSFLFSFIPSICPIDQKFPETFPGAFTVLIDPIAPLDTGDDLAPKPASCIASLNDVPEPDLILISRAEPDHCHEDSLCQLSPHVQSIIVGEPTAIKTIKRWKHFDHGNISSLRRYKRGRGDTLFRVEIPPPSPLGTSGEVTIALLAPKTGGTHNAIGITYREPSSILSQSRAMITGSPPMSQTSSFKPPTGAASTMTSTSEYGRCEPTIAVLYSPHGVGYDVIEPWVSGHLAPEAALPPVAMIHSTTSVNTSWYNGGNIIAGSPGGLEIARKLLPTAWIAAHDVDNTYLGGAVKNVWRTEYNILDVEASLWEELIAKGVKRKPQILRLDAGETLRIDTWSANKVVEELVVEVKKDEPAKAHPPSESAVDSQDGVVAEPT
jgi:hypothetical protein